MFTRTKIICTIGPAVGTLEKMVELIQSGMNVARLNFSHGDHEQHQKTVDLLKKAREITDSPMAIMIDTKGPEIRISNIKDGPITLKKDQLLKIVRVFSGEKDEIIIHPIEALECVKIGTKILFDDGYIGSEVLEKREDGGVLIRINNPGILKERKGVNIPDVYLNLPAMTDKDVDDLKFACRNDVEMIAASFIRSAEHVLSVKDLLAQEGKSEIMVVAKIENSEGIENFDSIVQVADGIMIGRGDLGVEVDLAKVPKLQKMMIRKCYHACKPVVTATQMLESMIVNPRPTRAEVSDVANAIYDSSSSVMLSGETAIGNYPIEAVKQMKHIAVETEQDFNYQDFFYLHSRTDYHDISSALALSAVKTGYSANAKAIFAFTSSGFTVRLVSRLRPEMPIIALTQNKKIYHQLAFYWGVIPLYVEKCTNARDAFIITSEQALKMNLVDFGDVVVVTSGSPFGKKGSTNMMMVEHIGNVLVKGSKGYGSKIEGKVVIVLSSERQDPLLTEDRILIIARCDQTYLPLIKHAAGVILQNHLEDYASEKYLLLVAKTFEIPVIVRADGAMSIIREGEIITLDPKKGIIYQGAEG